MTETTEALTPIEGQTIAPKPGRRFPWRLFVIVVVAILGVAALGVGVWYWGSKNGESSTAKKNTPSFSKPTNNEELLNQVNQFSSSGDYDTAQKVISSNSELAKSRDGLMATATVYYNAGKLDQALASYQDIAKSYGWTANLADLVASVYAQKGDKQQATTYYQKEIELLNNDKSDPMAKSTVAVVQKKIEGLK